MATAAYSCFLSTLPILSPGGGMADMKQVPKQTKAQKFFRKLNPASWFSRKNEEKASPLPQLDPELKRNFSILYIGSVMDGAIPLFPKYELGKKGDAHKKMDVAGALVERAKDSFGAMKSINKDTTPTMAKMYPQYHRNATQNLKDAVQLYAYAAALLADGSNLKNQANEKIKECKTLLEAVNQYHCNAVPGIKSTEEAAALSKTELTSEERARVQVNMTHTLFSYAKENYERMREELSNAMDGASGNEAAYDSYCKDAKDCASQAIDDYKGALEIAGYSSEAEVAKTASICLKKCEKLWREIVSHQGNKSIVQICTITLRKDAEAPYFSESARKIAVGIKQALEENSISLAEALIEFSPPSPFSQSAKRDFSRLLTAMIETPDFEPYVRKIALDYCEAVAARGT